MASKKRHKKIRRKSGIVLPDWAGSLFFALCLALGIFAPVRLVNIFGDEGSVYWAVALEMFFFLFCLLGIGCARSVSVMIRRRTELGDIRSARIIAGRALGTIFFISLFLAGAGYALTSLLCSGLMELPLAAMPFEIFLAALLPLSLLWTLSGILDAFGNEKPVRFWNGMLGLFCFVLGPLFAAPLHGYGKKVGALLQNPSYGPAYGALGAAAAFFISALVCMFGLLFSWTAAGKELRRMEQDETEHKTNETWAALIRNAMPVCIPALFLVSGLIGESVLFLKNGAPSEWGVYVGKCLPLVGAVLFGALALAFRMLPEFKLSFSGRSLRKSRDKCMLALRCTALYVVPAAVLFAALAEPVLGTLFKEGSLTDAYGPMRISALGIIFGGLSFMLGAILFSVELYYNLWAGLLLCMAVRLGSFYIFHSLLDLKLYSPVYADALAAFVLCLFLLMSVRRQLKISDLKLYSPVYADALAAFVLCLFLLMSVRRQLKISVSWGRIFLAPCISGAVMAGVCLLFSELLLKNTESPVRAIFSGTLGLLAYFVVSLLLKGATRRELRCLPGGQWMIRFGCLLRLL